MDPLTAIRLGVLVLILGEGVALASQAWAGPNSFLVFVSVGAGLVIVGMLIAVWGTIRQAGED